MEAKAFLLKLRMKGIKRALEWHKDDPDYNSDTLEELLFRTTELAGEVGEVCNEIKKYSRSCRKMKGGKVSFEDIGDELADVFICLDRVAEFFNIDLSVVTKNKFNKTSEKHGFETKF